MGKNGGGLIENRVIRNPMEQMRRKQKMREKEKRKEQKEFVRQEMWEARERTAHIDPLK